MYYIVSKQVYTPADAPWTVWPGTDGYHEGELGNAGDKVSELAATFDGFVFDIVDSDDVSIFTGDTLEVE